MGMSYYPAVGLAVGDKRGAYEVFGTLGASAMGLCRKYGIMGE
jgi:hypothetical protein